MLRKVGRRQLGKYAGKGGSIGAREVNGEDSDGEYWGKVVGRNWEKMLMEIA